MDVALDTVDARLRILLPEQYAEQYEQMAPVPMRAAGLKYGADGRVAWDEIWGSFCHLAMAGGPPHKGRLLEPGTPEAIAAEPAQYESVTEEICRGIWMAAELPAVPDAPGWIKVQCFSHTMAEWLARAITIENVAVRWSGILLYLPAAPHFRLDKEIKNVITVIAKTTHYWMGHVSRGQKATIADLLARLAAESPVIEADAGTSAAYADRVAAAVRADTGCDAGGQARGWLGVECGSEGRAVWMMRALLTFNVLARREDTTLCVPLNPAVDPDGALLSGAVRRTHALAAYREEKDE